MQSGRLTYEPLSPATLVDFHPLIQDVQVRRYLVVGEILQREWSEASVRNSSSLFAIHGIGIWLVRVEDAEPAIGFCGFLDMSSGDLAPQLVYALSERFTGRGYGTEMAQACIAEARCHGFSTILATVDEENARSLRILETLGFRTVRTQVGRFGNMFVMMLEA